MTEEILKLSGSMKEIPTKTFDVREVLTERGNRYGEFKTHALITQRLKRTFYDISPQADTLTASMREAIDMIFHKLGRIGNGDPYYLDSWVDIVGYTQLVIDELEKREVENGKDKDQDWF